MGMNLVQMRKALRDTQQDYQRQMASLLYTGGYREQKSQPVPKNRQSGRL